MSSKCPICYNIVDAEKNVVTSCNHRFCSKCFFKWIEKNPTCPVCRNRFMSRNNLELDLQQDELNRLIAQTEEQYITLDRTKIECVELEIKNKLLLAEYKELIKDIRNQIKEYEKNSAKINELKKKDLQLQRECSFRQHALEQMANYRREWEQLHNRRRRINRRQFGMQY